MALPSWGATALGDSLRVLISSQGLLVRRVFQAHLVSQVLWVPKVSQGPRMVPKFTMPRMHHRGPGAGVPGGHHPPSQAATTPYPRSV